MKWVDPRTPVSVEYVGKFKVSIYNMNAYLQSHLDYPDDPSQPARTVRTDNSKPTFAKRKNTARYNWIVKLEQPLKGRTA